MDDDFTVMGMDSSSPDEDKGHIGTPQHMWLEHQLDECVINEHFSIVGSSPSCRVYPSNRS